MSSEHHRQLIASLYRQSLRQAKSWINKRDLYRAKALEIRQQFQENLEERDPRRIHYLVGRTQALLKKYNHPDPIIPPQRPGGTKYERNVFPPQEERKLNNPASSSSDCCWARLIKRFLLPRLLTLLF
jgi:NADH dehydrogenase (ubiquinone) 1 beta subcomplex subunit 9